MNLQGCLALLRTTGIEPTEKVLTDPNILSACIQAAQTEHAAYIQAIAARQAGGMTIIAGVLAVVAAVIGGVFAYNSAKVQTALVERRHEAESKAYVEALAAILDNAKWEINWLKREATERLEGMPHRLQKDNIRSLKTETSLDNVARHSLLPTTAIKPLADVRAAVMLCLENIDGIESGSSFTRRVLEVNPTVVVGLNDLTRKLNILIHALRPEKTIAMIEAEDEGKLPKRRRSKS